MSAFSHDLHLSGSTTRHGARRGDDGHGSSDMVALSAIIARHSAKLTG
jgi:hypothetical protein